MTNGSLQQVPIENPHLIEKTLDILEAVGALGSASMPQIQAQCGLSTTTTHRIMQSLARRGYLFRAGRGNFRLGRALLALADRISSHDILAASARPCLQRLSKETRCHSHLGVWEDGMVTYLVKQRFGRTRVHSAEGMQLEAYCSALGKILLAALPDDILDRYLEDGAFVALTSKTIVDPGEIRDEIERVKQRGWSMDDEEIMDGLRCVAVPVRDISGTIIAAVSISSIDAARSGPDVTALLPTLFDAAKEIEGKGP
ncbi:IclR family transcriptional regulator [Sphingobium sp. JS3065]|uniref:IclR family transcriptional regulator n=1 Tax=Sphingobium sp. JS3065 TaxID=2970925 RepID=UPI002263DE09|nr:IclR family transcriptional regulator [Sphingobium sp. JS3065]UZW57228.1 IclR family transcriptional regulator [Sphingobium sp. JS3065]